MSNKMALDALTAAKTQLEILLPDYGRVHDEIQALAKIDAAIAALQAEPQWQPMEDAPHTRYIEVQQRAVYRWLPYKANSEQRRKGVLGRWQRHTGYGFENAELSGYGWRLAEQSLPATPPKD